MRHHRSLPLLLVPSSQWLAPTPRRATAAHRRRRLLFLLVALPNLCISQSWLLSSWASPAPPSTAAWLGALRCMRPTWLVRPLRHGGNISRGCVVEKSATTTRLGTAQQRNRLGYCCARLCASSIDSPTDASSWRSDSCSPSRREQSRNRRQDRAFATDDSSGGGVPKDKAKAFAVQYLSASLSEPPAMTTTNYTITSDTKTMASEYEKWVRRLYMTNLFHPVKLGLSNIETLHNALGAPLDQCVVVHIAGTNGKGSVALKIAHTLQLANRHKLRVGLFCSPHVSSFRERMSVNGTLISEEQVVELMPTIYRLCEMHDVPATFFEITTALAAAYFAQEQCDVVVLETGLGGRLDATNVIQQPALTIITSIGLEHTRILGDTIELIAREKAGICKPSCPVLVGPHVPHDVIRACAQHKGAGPYYISEDLVGASGRGNAEHDYDVENARIAQAALQLLQQSHGAQIGSIPDDIMKTGTSIRPPCRFEQIRGPGDGVRVVLDVAHNPSAMQYLVRKLRRTYPDDDPAATTFRFVVGMSNDKDLRLCGCTILDAVQGDASRIHLVQANHPRAAKLDEMLVAVPALANAHYNAADPGITRQVELALRLSSSNDEVVVVCGSVFLMAEARQALGIDEPRDSDYISAVAGANLRHGQENFGNTKVVAENAGSHVDK